VNGVNEVLIHAFTSTGAQYAAFAGEPETTVTLADCGADYYTTRIGRPAVTDSGAILLPVLCDSGQVQLYRVLPDGTQDMTFAGTGNYELVGAGGVSSLCYELERTTVAGTEHYFFAGSGGDIAYVVRIHAGTGALDEPFGTAGVVALDITPGVTDSITHLAADPSEGALLVGGKTHATNELFLIKLSTVGVPRTTGIFTSEEALLPQVPGDSDQQEFRYLSLSNSEIAFVYSSPNHLIVKSYNDTGETELTSRIHTQSALHTLYSQLVYFGLFPILKVAEPSGTWLVGEFNIGNMNEQPDSQMKVFRIKPDGTRDMTFGEQDFFANSAQPPCGWLFQADHQIPLLSTSSGRIYMACAESFDGTGNVQVRAFDASSGQRISTFDGDGTLKLEMTMVYHFDEFDDLVADSSRVLFEVPQSNGDIILAYEGSNGAFERAGVVFVRIAPNGSYTLQEIVIPEAVVDAEHLALELIPADTEDDIRILVSYRDNSNYPSSTKIRKLKLDGSFANWEATGAPVLDIPDTEGTLLSTQLSLFNLASIESSLHPQYPLAFLGRDRGSDFIDSNQWVGVNYQTGQLDTQNSVTGAYELPHASAFPGLKIPLPHSRGWLVYENIRIQPGFDILKWQLVNPQMTQVLQSGEVDLKSISGGTVPAGRVSPIVSLTPSQSLNSYLVTSFEITPTGYRPHYRQLTVP